MQWIVCFLFIYAFILRLNNIKSQLYNLTSKRICLRFYLCIFNRSLCSVGKSLMIHAHVCRRDVPSPAVPWISSARWRRLAIRSSCSMPLAWTRAAAQWPLASKWIPFSLSVICQLIRIVLCSCRKTQGVFDKCMKDNFDWDRPSYGYFARAKVSCGYTHFFHILISLWVNNRLSDRHARHQRKRNRLRIPTPHPDCQQTLQLHQPNMVRASTGWNRSCCLA